VCRAAQENRAHVHNVSIFTNWVQELQLLSSFATTQPHAAYAEFTHELICSLLEVFLILTNFFNHLKTTWDIDRDLLALPTQVGGMGIINPIKTCSFQFSTSEKVTMLL